MDRKIGPDNQGEGNRDAASSYNQDTRNFIKSGRVARAARQARDAVDGPEAKELRKAEREGRSHARGGDI